MQSMMTDLGMSAQVRVWKDSNAAKAIASRRGHGKTSHVKWVPDVTKSERAKMRLVPGEQHLADHLTKGKSWRKFDDSIRRAGGRMKVSHCHQGNEHGGRSGREGNALTAPTSHDAGHV